MIYRKLTYVIFLILGMLSILSFTALHDPLLHGFMAVVNGWSVIGWDKGILTGFTIAEVTVEQYAATPLWGKWFYYMLPSLVLFFIPPIIYFIEPERLIAMFSVVLMLLNIASLSPERLLEGSDSAQGLQILLEEGVNPLIAVSLHWGIFILAMVTLFTVLWVAFDEDKEDAEERVDDLVN